ncbi:ABC transporter ATP-binding protein [Corallincola holothuriorum]|uniref:ABC transporter ATP-binding protein n=1 Tax=Corallincola holothuriorum TaxID=2282215 RepID=A0A368NS38_9GAMM|nr:ABC transporter ATP-binding protein [Corallincola holothuriorum]RCU52484.1 ABC transporter ATP-binding protein [Corallincola holothuriorum]
MLIGEYLKSFGFINQQNIDEALKLQVRTGWQIGQCLVHLNCCNEQQLQMALTTQWTRQSKRVSITKQLVNLFDLARIANCNGRGMLLIALQSFFCASLSIPVLLTLYLQIVVGHIAVSGDIDELTNFSIGFILLLVLGVFLQLISYITTSWVSSHSCSRLTRQLIDKQQNLSYPLLSRVSTQKIVKLTTVNMESVSRLLSNILPELFKALFTIIISLIVILVNSSPEVLLLVPLMFALMGISVRYAVKGNSAIDEENISATRLSKKLSELITAFLPVVTSASSKVSNSTLNSIDAHMLKQGKKWKAWYSAGVVSYSSDFLIKLTTIWLGGVLFLNGDISIGPFLALVISISILVPSFEMLYQIYMGTNELEIQLKEIRTVTCLPDDDRKLSKLLGRNTQTIQLHAVDFHYAKEEKQALESVSLQLKAGHVYLIKGQSGSGKSTLLKILSGKLLPSAGHVKFDEINIEHIPFFQMRKVVGEVSSEDAIVRGVSIRSYITMGAEDIDEERYQRALADSICCDLISKLDIGDQTIVGKHREFSGGEEQRIKLAQAFYRDETIQIYDEATSALDIRSTAHVYGRLFKPVPGKIKIIVSHNALSSQYCENIIRIRNGKIERATEVSEEHKEMSI